MADASNPAVYEQISATYKVLEEIGIERKDTLLVLNKIDLLPDRVRVDGLMNRYPTAVAISARAGQGLPILSAAVSDALSRGFVNVDVEIGVENGRLLAYLAAHGEVLSKHYNDSSVRVHCRISPHHLARVTAEAISVHTHGGKPEKSLIEDVA